MIQIHEAYIHGIHIYVYKLGGKKKEKK